MARLTDWQWWVGTAESVELEGIYDIGEFATRDEAIRAALRDLPAGDRFAIVEARLWDRSTEPPDDIQWFARARNKETLTAGPHLVGAS